MVDLLLWSVNASAKERSLPLTNAALDCITESAQETLHKDQKKRQHIIAENITEGKKQSISESDPINWLVEASFLGYELWVQ